MRKLHRNLDIEMFIDSCKIKCDYLLFHFIFANLVTKVMFFILRETPYNVCRNFRQIFEKTVYPQQLDARKRTLIRRNRNNQKKVAQSFQDSHFVSWKKVGLHVCDENVFWEGSARESRRKKEEKRRENWKIQNEWFASVHLCVIKTADKRVQGCALDS